MKPNAYKIISMAVESGVMLGVTRAHKHTDNPTIENLETAIIESVMNEICEWFDFDDPSN